MKIALLIFGLVQLALAQYKAPLYMGFLMPKKYIRKLTNMQSKPIPNCGSMCPFQQNISGHALNHQTCNFIESFRGQNFNQDFQQPAENFLSANHQFNSYQSNNQNSNQQQQQASEVKFPFVQWEKNVQNFNNKEPVVTKFVCCNNGASNVMPTNDFNFGSRPLSTSSSYSNGFNRQANLYGKKQWMETPSFDQWVHQQPQDGPFVLYTGPQMQQQRQSYMPLANRDVQFVYSMNGRNTMRGI